MRRYRIFGLLLAFVLLFSPVHARAGEDPAAEMRAGILQYHGVSDERGLAETLAPGGAAEWYVFALRLGGGQDFSAYRSALSGFV